MRCTGMEFALEMLVKGALMRLRTSEVPIRLAPDGRAAAGSAEAGQAKAIVCAACHGAENAGIARSGAPGVSEVRRRR